jgi:hypothetical protein
MITGTDVFVGSSFDVAVTASFSDVSSAATLRKPLRFGSKAVPGVTELKRLVTAQLIVK